MHKNIQPAITPLSLGHIIKLLKTFGPPAKMPIARDLAVIYQAGREVRA